MLNPKLLLECYGENYIGFRGICGDESTSGLYVNDEVNVTLRKASVLANEEEITPEELLKRLVRNAVIQTANKFLIYLEKYSKLQAKKGCDFTNLICENKDVLMYPIFYHVIGSFFKEKWQTTNIDPWINTNKDEAEQMYNEYLWGFEDKASKYKEALIFSAKAAKTTMSHHDCFKCSGSRIVNLV